MKIFYDTEFLENGSTIELISIGLVAEDGREIYQINALMPLGPIQDHPWLMEHVVPSLPLKPWKDGGPWDHDHPDIGRVQPPPNIADDVEEFIRQTPDPELWAYYAAYDHVALCQLWGRMIELPSCVPMFTCDLKQEAVRQGNPELPKQAAGLHNALADARHNMEIAKVLGLI